MTTQTPTPHDLVAHANSFAALRLGRAFRVGYGAIKKTGYSQAVPMADGFDAWSTENRASDKPAPVSYDESHADKAVQRGGMIFVADRWYPSSKTCSDCGHTLETLPLAVREWACPACGSIHDRDVNAAINLKNLAVSSTVSACGEEGAGLGRKLKTKPASAKRESSSKATYGSLCVGMEERFFRFYAKARER